MVFDLVNSRICDLHYPIRGLHDGIIICFLRLEVLPASLDQCAYFYSILVPVHVSPVRGLAELYKTPLHGN